MKMDKPIGAVLMYIRAVVSANPNRLLAVFLTALLIAMPMAGFAQGQKPSKSRQKPGGKQQSPPESVKPDADQKPEQSEARKAGEDKPDDENKPRDPMST